MYQSSMDKTGRNNQEIQQQISDPPTSLSNVTSVVAEVNDQTIIAAQMENNAIYHNHFEPREIGVSANPISLSSQSNITSKTDLEEGKSSSGFSRSRFSKNRQDKNRVPANSSNVKNDPEILNLSNSSKHCRVLPSVISMQSIGTRVSYKEHRRNVSNMSGKPVSYTHLTLPTIYSV